MKKYFLQEFQEICMNFPTIQEVYPLVYTDFGKMLFDHDLSKDSTQKIKLYIDYLNSYGRIKEVEE